MIIHDGSGSILGLFSFLFTLFLVFWNVFCQIFGSFTFGSKVILQIPPPHSMFSIHQCGWNRNFLDFAWNTRKGTLSYVLLARVIFLADQHLGQINWHFRIEYRIFKASNLKPNMPQLRIKFIFSTTTTNLHYPNHSTEATLIPSHVSFSYCAYVLAANSNF